MKNLEYYMSLPYRMEVVPDIEEGGYMASFPELPGCLTCADTMEELIINAQDAKKAWLEASLADGDIIPEPIAGEDTREYSGQFKIRMPKSLHRSLSLRAKAEGISMNQYCIYLLSKGDSSNLSHLA